MTRINLNINDISETALLTIFCHAIDANLGQPVLNDRSSLKTLEILRPHWSRSQRKLYTRLSGILARQAVNHIVIRAKKYDEYARKFIRRHPKATVVNIGCGLDNRFKRIDNGQIKFYDLDLPDVIDIKRQIFAETDRYRFISQSVFDYDWMDNITNSDVIFLAEGVFMYCEYSDVKGLFLKILENLPGAEMVCEVFNSIWLKAPFKKIMESNFQRTFGLGQDAVFRFGIVNSLDIVRWHKAITLLDEWSYLESHEKRLGWLRILKNVPLFNRTLWTVHYRLGTKSTVGNDSS